MQMKRLQTTLKWNRIIVLWNLDLLRKTWAGLNCWLQLLKPKNISWGFGILIFEKKKESLIWHKLFQTLEVFSINLENKQVLEVRNSLKFCKVSTRISFWLPFFRMPRWLLRCFLKKRVLFFPYWSQAICEANMIVMVFEKLCTLIYFTASGLF